MITRHATSIGATPVSPFWRWARRATQASPLLLVLLVGCWRDDMSDDGHAKPMEASPFFSDGKIARPLINGTVPRGGHMVSDPMYAVTATTQPEATKIARHIDRDELLRGREQYTIFCAPCHGQLGDGNGMIVQRGFPRPPAFYPIAEHQTQRPELFPREVNIANAPPGHVYNVISHGYGAMYSYDDRIKEDDRWRIVAYVRALQLTANAGPTTQPSAATATTQPANR
jgi:mono/diheme cytochrome c family protein